MRIIVVLTFVLKGKGNVKGGDMAESKEKATSKPDARAMRMRRVDVYELDENRGGLKIHKISFSGYFHCWDGNEDSVFAVVEKEDGWIEVINSSRIKFVI